MAFNDFEEFWTFYLGEHARPATRALHFAGTSAVVATAALALLKRKPGLLALLPVVGYGPAWVSHFFIERNRPATFRYPLESLRADFRMWSRMLRGELWTRVPSEADQAR
jgi:hypothetical protein